MHNQTHQSNQIKLAKEMFARYCDILRNNLDYSIRDIFLSPSRKHLLLMLIPISSETGRSDPINSNIRKC